MVGNTQHYIKNLKHFLELIKTLGLMTDILTSFDKKSLFTKVPVEETLQLFHLLFQDKKIKLFHHCLTSFWGNNVFYEQKDGKAMSCHL